MILRELENLSGFNLTNIHYAEDIMLMSDLKGKRKKPLDIVVKKSKKKNWKVRLESKSTELLYNIYDPIQQFSSQIW